jgi:hypothetical protein
MNSTFFQSYMVSLVLASHPLHILMPIVGVQDYMLDVDHQDMVSVNEYAEEDEPPAPLEFLQFALQFF